MYSPVYAYQIVVFVVFAISLTFTPRHLIAIQRKPSRNISSLWKKKKKCSAKYFRAGDFLESRISWTFNRFNEKDAIIDVIRRTCDARCLKNIPNSKLWRVMTKSNGKYDTGNMVCFEKLMKRNIWGAQAAHSWVCWFRYLKMMRLRFPTILYRAPPLID